MVLKRWNPYRELKQMEDTMDRLWRIGGFPAYREGSEDWNILIDVMQKNDDIIVSASVPGIKPEQIDVAVEDNVLTIRAIRKSEAADDVNYLIKERPEGSFFRALRLPDTVDSEKIESSYCNGVLTITMPKAEEKKKKQIEVKVVNEPETIETTAK
ncbi:MAG: Hsp20/alpha crystallin family protein [Dehalococcoidales bacterium]|jgi:HSP20 family protein|nr:Hsp20/alpha crystallin family protein [Dehalococcoidales bacterium]